jgi:calcium-dependent protein kinase
MESCPGGELFDSREIILKNGRSFTERQSCEIIKKCLSALNHCHKLNVIHRDIKPENMMFGKDGDIRLVDFGLAQETDKNLAQIAGTPYFMSPDVLDGNYGAKSDVWSLGCVMFMLVAGALPFQGASRSEVFDKIR